MMLPLSMTSDNQYVTANDFMLPWAWIGATGPTTVAAMTDATCLDWTSASPSQRALAGASNSVAGLAYAYYDLGCNDSALLYCLEE